MISAIFLKKSRSFEKLVKMQEVLVAVFQKGKLRIQGLSLGPMVFLKVHHFRYFRTALALASFLIRSGSLIAYNPPHLLAFYAKN